MDKVCGGVWGTPILNTHVWAGGRADGAELHKRREHASSPPHSPTSAVAPSADPAQAKVVLAAALVVFGHVGGGVLYAVTAVCCGLVLLIAQWEYPAVQSAGSVVPVNSTVDEEMKESRLRELRRYPPNAVLLAVYAGLAVMYVYQLVVTATLSGASSTPAPASAGTPLSPSRFVGGKVVDTDPSVTAMHSACARTKRYVRVGACIVRASQVCRHWLNVKRR